MTKAQWVASDSDRMFQTYRNLIEVELKTLADAGFFAFGRAHLTADTFFKEAGQAADNALTAISGLKLDKNRSEQIIISSNIVKQVVEIRTALMQPNIDPWYIAALNYDLGCLTLIGGRKAILVESKDKEKQAKLAWIPLAQEAVKSIWRDDPRLRQSSDATALALAKVAVRGMNVTPRTLSKHISRWKKKWESEGAVY